MPLSSLDINLPPVPAAIEDQYARDRLAPTADVYHLLTLHIKGYGFPFIIGGTTSDIVRTFGDEVRTAQYVASAPWLRMVNDKYAPTDSHSLQKTADAAFAAVRSGEIDLSLINQGEVNGEHLAILLRCIASWRSQLRGWQMAIDAAKQALVSEGKDPKDIMFGMV